jgi:serine/threonine-protein kinase
MGRTVAGRYEIQERLGAGTIFGVYRGRDRSSGRQVVVKALLPEVRESAAFVGALRKTLAGLGDLAHPNIARVYEVVEEDGSPVIVSEFVRGINLKERIKRIAPFTLSVAVDFAASICEALHHGHASEVIHGDVRPHNVIVSPEGVLKVTDFGLARAMASSSEVAARHLGRAIHYQAPETAAKGIYMPATDLYALGVVVFEMLTGSLPYAGESPIQVAMRHQNDPVPSPRSLNPGVPKALEGLVLKAMQKAPEQRYPSAADMLTDLRAVRDAFRFGRSLSWSPMAPDPPAPSAPEATAAPTARPEPTKRPDAPSEPPRRELPPMPVRRNDDDRISPWLRFAIGTMIVVILLGGVFGAALWMATFSRPESNTFPDIVGRPIAEAQRAADKVKVKLIQREEFNDRYDPGTVYRTSYEPGREIRAGRSVVVWVSRGSRLVWVPDITRLTADQAEIKLREAGLVPGQVNRQFSDTVPFGTIISQNPRSGKRVDRDTPVSLVISDGSEDGSGSSSNATQDVDAEHTWNITHRVRRDGLGDRQVRIEYEDTQGSATAFDESRPEGDTIRVQVNGRGPTLIVRVYYSDDPLPVSETTQIWDPAR